MNDFLTRLAQRALRLEPAIKPRPVSIFEPAVSAVPPVVIDYAVQEDAPLVSAAIRDRARRDEDHSQDTDSMAGRYISRPTRGKDEPTPEIVLSESATAPSTPPPSPMRMTDVKSPFAETLHSLPANAGRRDVPIAWPMAEEQEQRQPASNNESATGLPRSGEPTPANRKSVATGSTRTLLEQVVKAADPNTLRAPAPEQQQPRSKEGRPIRAEVFREVTPRTGQPKKHLEFPVEEKPGVTVEVTIGRIEVRAINGPEMKERPIATKRPLLPLDEYLKQRGRDPR